MGTELVKLAKRSELTWLIRASCLAAVGAMIAACASPQPKVNLPGQKSKEYFSEKEYGVKASPRVSIKRSGIKRGGGRDQVGKPYKVKGKWYYPKAVRSYSKVGKASWYGAAFHGRLTANGEIYDMTHLTAAHPTLPLPSYARVTNLTNGSSVIVRINDRGPFARGRIIDLSKRAAEMLDYTHSGIAKVKVDYIGRAPLHGQDDSYLLASYRRNGASSPSDGLPSGVMIALDGTTPERGDRRRPRFVRDGLPEAGPILPDRPGTGLVARLGSDTRILAYSANNRLSDAEHALNRFATNGMTSADIIKSWKQQSGNSTGETIYVGTFADPNQADKLQKTLSKFGRTELQNYQQAGNTVLALTLQPDHGKPVNEILRMAWSSGAPDAMILRRD